jgi:hypothetical protein
MNNQTTPKAVVPGCLGTEAVHSMYITTGLQYRPPCRHRQQCSVTLLDMRVSQPVNMKSTVLCVMTPCSLVGIDRHYIRTYCLSLEARSVRQVPSEKEFVVTAVRTSNPLFKTLRRLVAGFPPQQPGFELRSCGICGGLSGTGTGFLPVLKFPRPSISPTIPQSSLSSSIVLSRYNRPNSGRRT